MKTDVENWLTKAGRTLDSAPDAPRGLYDRLKYIADIVKDAGKLSSEPQIAWRLPSGEVRAEKIGDKLVVGREAPSDVIVDDAQLSHHHFRIWRKGASLWIEDLESRNGTYVNGSKIDSHELRDGDIIEAGGQVFVFLGGRW